MRRRVCVARRFGVLVALAPILATASCGGSHVRIAKAPDMSKSPVTNVAGRRVSSTQRGSNRAIPPPLLRPHARYVALGSSFAAGPGIPAQDHGLCGRSDHNYPSLVAAKLGLDLSDVSCSGATTADVTTTPQGSLPPQIDAVSAATALVTFTVGGNDIGYSADTIECAAMDANGGSCAAVRNSVRTRREVAALPGDLTAMIDHIRARAPSARIVMVTYPKVIPDHAATCAALSLSAPDAAFVASLGRQLETIFTTVAAATHVTLADPYVRSDGHGPCATNSERWIEGATPRSSGAPFHPNENGHIEMASLVIAALGSR